LINGCRCALHALHNSQARKMSEKIRVSSLEDTFPEQAVSEVFEGLIQFPGSGADQHECPEPLLCKRHRREFPECRPV
jgi:hypothetical protein